MSTSPVSFHNFTAYNVNNTINPQQQIRQEFQKLGEDLQSGNLSAAQSDFSALQQLTPQSSATSTTNSATQAFNQLAQDLKSGNLSAAQQDFTQLQQDFQSKNSRVHHHHHHGGSGGQGNQVNQLFLQLGQELQAGNLSTAQQTYASLQQDVPFISQSSGTLAGQSTSPSSVISALA